MQTIYNIKNLTRWYPNSEEIIFHNFNFRLEKGDFCFVIGNSGIGKTSLLKLLIGQLKAPIGTLYYGNKDIARYSPDEIQQYRQQIGVIFQDYKLLETKNVEENVRYPLDIDGKQTEQEIQSQVVTSMKHFGIIEKRKARIETLSWGEKQRVAIARAMIHNPSVLIADEATGNLDEENSKNIMDTLIDINRSGTSILCITHDVGLIEYCKQQHNIIRIIKIS
jgi:cell division transport system ATP-binding protein